MRILPLRLTSLLFACVGILPLHAQNSPNLTDPFAILTYKDSAGSCVPQQADNGAINVAGCCASPGRRGCTGDSDGSPLPACLALEPNLTFDPYGEGILCTQPAVTVDPIIPTLGQTGSDMTFYVASDIHFFRRTFNLTDQLTHVKVLNNFYSTGADWPTGAGIPANTPVGQPLAIIIDGDITTHGLAQDLGAFRLNYERGTVPSSIQYPVLFGLGNHETVSDETPENAKRMFDYLQQRMANTDIDPASGNYSWDWQGVHFVQMNTWAGDQTSLYVHASDGLAWLANDLKTHVGNTTKPVMLFEHYLLKNVYPGRVANSTNDDFFPADSNAIDSTGAKTGQGYESFWKIIQNYNVIGMFGGHDHCLGMYSTMLSNLPVTGPLYPGVPGYATPMDNFDDGSGGDTGDGADNVAGVGNGCAVTTINGQSVPQTAVASFLVAHVNAHYLDIAAVSWTGDGSTPYFDPAEGLPTGALACRKRINSQFIPLTSGLQITQTASGYSVTPSVDTPANIPVALQFNSRSGLRGFNFVDACADPTDTGTNNLYFLVNGENPLTAATTYAVAATRTANSTPTPTAVLLTPLSGTSPVSFTHTGTTAPADDTLTIYGPPNTAFTTAISYSGTAANWLTLTPASDSFNSYGIATLTLHYTTPATGFGTSNATIAITSGATSVVQNAIVTITQPALTLALSSSSIYQTGAVALSASLTPAATGTSIAFIAGTTVLGTATTDSTGTATFTYTANATGTLSLTATDSTGALTSAAQTLTVGPPVTLTTSSNSITILPGNSGTLALTLTPFGGYTGTATLTCTSPVAYVTCAPASSTIALTADSTGNTTATINVAATLASYNTPGKAALLFAGLIPLFLFAARSRRRTSLLLMLLAIAFSFTTGCGNVTAPGNTSTGAQHPSGSQPLTLTATANGITQSTAVTVNFQ